MKLTKAQRGALEWGGGRITYDTRDARAWAVDPNGATKKVHLSVFNSLTLMGAIATPYQATGRRIYTITDAGRAALAEQGVRDEAE